MPMFSFKGDSEVTVSGKFVPPILAEVAVLEVRTPPAKPTTFQFLTVFVLELIRTSKPSGMNVMSADLPGRFVVATRREV